MPDKFTYSSSALTFAIYKTQIKDSNNCFLFTVDPNFTCNVNILYKGKLHFLWTIANVARKWSKMISPRVSKMHVINFNLHPSDAVYTCISIVVWHHLLNITAHLKQINGKYNRNTNRETSYCGTWLRQCCKLNKRKWSYSGSFFFSI